MTSTRPPIVAAELWTAVMAAAQDRCQCQGACGKKHLDDKRKPGRCQLVNGQHVSKVGRITLLAIPRDPTAPWHEAAQLPPRLLIAFCRPCADGVRRTVNRAVKAMPPQSDGLFDAEPYTVATGGRSEGDAT